MEGQYLRPCQNCPERDKFNAACGTSVFDEAARMQQKVEALDPERSGRLVGQVALINSAPCLWPCWRVAKFHLEMLRTGGYRVLLRRDER